MSSDKCKKEKKLSTGKRIGLAILIILAVLALAAVMIYRSLIVKPQLPSHNTPVRPPVSVIDPDAEQTAEPVKPVFSERKSKDFYTILVAGTDTVSASTDTIMLISYDVTNQKATVMAIPRDMLVSAYGTDRKTTINSIYVGNGRGEKGRKALCAEVAELVGFMPDYCVIVQWELVGQMVDALGGVQYDVPFHMEYDDPTQDLHIYVEKGLQTLDGDAAMQVVRWRKNNPGVSGGGGGSDLNRIKVQQGFLKAVLKQTLQIQNVTKINELAGLFSRNLEGDLTLENLLWFATQAVFGGLEVESVEFLTMPWKAAGNKVYPDQEKLLELINTKMNPYVTDVTAEHLDLIYFDAEGNLCSTGED